MFKSIEYNSPQWRTLLIVHYAERSHYFLGNLIQNAQHGDSLHSDISMADILGAFSFWFKYHPLRESFRWHETQEPPQLFFPPHNQDFVYLFVWSYFHHLKKSVQIMVRKNILNFINFENVWNKNERKSGGRGSMFIVGIRHFINAVLNRKSTV